MTKQPTPDATDGPDEDAAADAETAEPAAGLEKDVVFEILKNQRRRRVLQYLIEHGETELGTLAEAIAAEENDTTVEEISADERKRVYIGLYQTHLPKMDDSGVVRYDQNDGVVSAGPAIDQLSPYLETAADDGNETSATESEDAGAAIDLSGLAAPVTLPAWGLFGALLLVGLVSVAATSLPGPAWAVVLAGFAIAATWVVRWQ